MIPFKDVLNDKFHESWWELFANEKSLTGFTRNAYDCFYKSFVGMAYHSFIHDLFQRNMKPFPVVVGLNDQEKAKKYAAVARFAEPYIRAIMLARLPLNAYAGSDRRVNEDCLKNYNELRSAIENGEKLLWRNKDINGCFCVACDEFRLPHEVRDYLKASIMILEDND